MYFGRGTSTEPLYGPVSCVTACSGGITGVFVSVAWTEFQSVHTGGGNSTVELDNDGKLAILMSSINSIENPYGHTGTGPQFALTMGLKAGDNAAYDVLDLYADAAGAPGGMDPNYSIEGALTKDEVETAGGCGFTYTPSNSNTITGNGKTFGTLGLPEQCVMRTNGPTLACVQQPRIWGSDAASTAANGYYVTAYARALQDLANFISGDPAVGYTNQYGHHIQALKLAGISSHDEEISIPGEANLAEPSGYYCGDSNAIVQYNEQIWTQQTDESGDPIYQTSVMESTWLSLVAASTSVTSYLSGDSLGYIIDVVGGHEFPPVQPAGCSLNCSYTAKTDPQISGLTTGEMEHLIQRTLDAGLLSIGNLTIQDQGVQYDQPDVNPTVESSYGTTEIPCALNAANALPIGYQSGTYPSNTVTALNKPEYLQSLTNGAAYGAQYEELFPADLNTFITDLTPVAFNGHSNYGTTQEQNRNMLSTTISAALATMALNAENSSAGSLCPQPYIVVNQYGVVYDEPVPWTYPYP